MENSLRWTRRWIVIVLILANLTAVFLADAASVTRQPRATLPPSSIQAEIIDMAAYFTSP
jgi:hypothetical protein